MRCAPQVLLAVCLLLTPLGAQEVKPPALLPPVSSAALVVTTDTSTCPECAPWAEQAKKLVELWHPVLSAYLDTPGAKPAQTIKLEFKDMPGVAHASGSVITISTRWIKAHPEDLGMVVHELSHVIQAYPPSKHGWLVEGIADYIRFWMCEPSGQPKTINRSTDHYRKGYRVTGAFLAWIEQQHQVLVIRECNLALRKGTYEDGLFVKLTGKDLDTLWAEFVTARTGSAP